MVSDDTQTARTNGSSKTGVIVRFISAIVIILITLISNFSGPVRQIFFKTSVPDLTVVESASPAVVSSAAGPDMPATTQTALSPAVQTLDQYYGYINAAKTRDDLSKAWDLLTTKFKCNLSDKCDYRRYRTSWWQSKVQYKLYECGSNIVDAEVISYLRKADGPLPAARADFIRYKLIDQDGSLKLESGQTIEQIGTGCKLAVSRP